MSPDQQLLRLLAEIPAYEAKDVVTLLPLSAALQTALYVRILALQHQAALPDTDHLLNVQEIAQRLGKSTKWVREHLALLPFHFQLGQELRFSARKLGQWIDEQSTATMAQALPPKGRRHER